MRERLARWLRCRIMRMHTYDWQAIFDDAGAHGTLYGSCLYCGYKGWPD